MRRWIPLMVIVGIAWGMVGSAVAAWKAPQDQWTYALYDEWPVPGAIDVTVGGELVYVASTTTDKITVLTRDGVITNSWGSAGSDDGQFNNPYGIDYSDGEVFVADAGNARIQVFDATGGLLRVISNPLLPGNEVLSSPRDCAADGTHLFVADSAQDRILVLTRNGEFVRAWGGAGSLPGQFGALTCIDVDEMNVYVTDYSRKRIQVFSKGGSFVRMWSIPGSEGNVEPTGMAVDAARVYTTYGRCTWYGGGRQNSFNSALLSFTKDGQQVYQTVQYNPNTQDPTTTTQRPLVYPRGVAVDGSFIYVADAAQGWVQKFRRVFRTRSSPLWETKAIALGDVLKTTQRHGSSVLEVDWTVVDSDSPSVAAYPLAFTNDTPSLASCLPLKSLVDGTEANIGTNIIVGVTNRISWDVGADWNVDYGNVRIAILAKDDRELLDIHWLHLPAVAPNPALTINRYPITENDLLNLWFWVIASGNPAASLVGGEVTGVGGGYDGELLATDAGTTERGRAFLFEMLGCREATPAELVQAREASTPGSVTQWEPRYKLPSGVPKKVNEFGFDSGSTDADGWWVVRE